jgi:hypothetical protein
MKKVTKDELIVALAACGWKMDRFGNMQRERYVGLKDQPIRKYRVKLQATSVRVEVQITFNATEYSPARNEWSRLDGAYMKDITITDGIVKIGRFTFRPKAAA